MKKTIRLNESELVRIVEGTARKMLNELDWKTYANASKDAYRRFEKHHNPNAALLDDRNYRRAREFNNASQEAFNRDYIKPNHPRGWAQYMYRRGDSDESMDGSVDMAYAMHHGEEPNCYLHAGPDGCNGLGWDWRGGKDLGMDSYDMGEGRYDDSGGYVEYRPMVSFDKSMDSDRYFGDNEDAKGRWNSMKDEMSDYMGGKYRYDKGRGWTK